MISLFYIPTSGCPWPKATVKPPVWNPGPKIEIPHPENHVLKKLSEKWLLITSLNGCSLEQKLPTDSPDRTRPVTPFFTSAISGLRSVLECRNLISSNSFAHRLGTGNFALRLAPGPGGLNGQTDGQIDERTDTERGCRIGLTDYRCRMSCQTDRRTTWIYIKD